MSDSPAYVIQCTGFCGRVILTRDEYLRQLAYADIGWVCPGCKRPAIWVDQPDSPHVKGDAK